MKHWWRDSRGAAEECSPGRSPGFAVCIRISTGGATDSDRLFRPSVAPSQSYRCPRADARGYILAPLRGSIIFLALVIFLSCSRPYNPATVRIAVGGQTQFIYLPLTLAGQLGYFKDEGLSVSIS